MFMPTRIDHHGWQLAMLSLVIAGLADPDRRRGGLTTGLASALSLSIGLEMLIYLALAGAAQVLMWVVDRGERERLLAYAVSIAGGCAAGFLLFASYANRAPVCDACRRCGCPTRWSAARCWRCWPGAVPSAGPPAGARRRRRLAVAAFHALAWPHCLSRLEGVSPEVERLWLSNVREAKPITGHSWRTAVTIASLPAAG
jgi:hypothetical protein